MNTPLPDITKKATIEINGINPYVHISAAEAATLKQGWRKHMPVRVQINGIPEDPWHINMVPMGNGDFYLYLHNNIRKPADAKVGDTVAIRVWFDGAYQSGPQDLPDWFAEALADNPAAEQSWQALSPSRQKEVVRYLTRLKGDDAKQRNLDLAIQALTGEQTRFLGRTWQNGK